MYAILYSKQAEKSFLKLSDKKTRLRVKKTVDSLSQDPRKIGVIKLKVTVIAPYRYCVGNYRILFDVDDEKRQILIYDIRKRDEETYRF